MAHIHELIDFTAGVYIVHKDKVLIRQHEKYGFWIHVGGHIELNEHPVEAAVREAKEEVGLDIKIPGYDGMKAMQNNLPIDSDACLELPPPNHMNIHRINETHLHMDILYYASSDTDEVVPENPNDKWAWLTEEEVKAHIEMSPHIKEYALCALRALGTI
jgi:8-oxo-dGTP pyrophosphatase MutT (NUDIX family)